MPPGPVRALWVIVAINLAVFAAWTAAPWIGPGAERFMEANFLVSWRSVVHGRVWTLLTSELSHQSLLHLTVNMVAMVSLGIDLERVLGWRAFAHLYVAGGIVASAAHALYDGATPGYLPALGASGAVMSVVVASAYLFPGRRLLVFFLIPMPQMLAIGLFLAVDLFGLVSPGVDHVAHAAHLGGAVYGWWFQRWVMGGYLGSRMRGLAASARRFLR